MLKEAGWVWPDGRVWSETYLDGVQAIMVLAKARDVLDALLADPETYRALNPSNGWGDYDGLVEEWATFVEACRQHPHAIIGTGF